jgi:hypothetical protein
MYQTDQPEWLPALDIAPPVRQRRLTVLLRLLLLVPQFIVMAVLGVVTFFAAIAAWFAALVLGGLPGWAESYLSGYVAYTTRVYASLYLLVDRYPPFSFTDPGSPVQVEFHPGRLNRLAVLFRIILAIPAGIIAAVLTAGWEALSFFCWLVVLILGRTPEPLFEATAAILRYTMRLQAYFLMLTPAYPKRLFGDRTPAGAPLAREPGGSDGDRRSDLDGWRDGRWRSDGGGWSSRRRVRRLVRYPPAAAVGGRQDHARPLHRLRPDRCSRPQQRERFKHQPELQRQRRATIGSAPSTQSR